MNKNNNSQGCNKRVVKSYLLMKTLSMELGSSGQVRKTVH